MYKMNAFAKSIVFLLCVGLSLLPHRPISSAAAQTATYAPPLDQYYANIEAARLAVNRESFDLALIGDALAFGSAEEIVDWVRTNIAFELYNGLLRGPEGTVLSRAGNALDQAVLLARLLGDAGYDTRVVEGRLTEKDAQRLVLAMAEERQPVLPPTVPLLDALKEVRRSADDVVASGTFFETAHDYAATDYDGLEIRVGAMAEAILTKLADQGFDIAGTGVAALVEEAQTYFWVEARQAPTQPWAAYHPAFPDDVAQLTPEVSETFSGAVPKRLQHRLRIDVSIEQKIGDRIRTHQLISGWERPTANLSGVPLVLTTLPWSFEPYSGSDPKQLVNNNNFFFTTINGENPSGRVFDSDGNVGSADEALSAPGALFRTAGQAVGRATSVLNALDSDSAPVETMALTAQWIDLTLISPGGVERTVRRTVVDRIGAEARGDGSMQLTKGRLALLPMLGSRTVMVATGRLPVPFVIERKLQAITTTRPEVEYLLQRALGKDAPVAQARSEAPPPSSLEPLGLFGKFDLAPTRKRPAFRASPSLLVIGDILTTEEEDVVYLRQIDVIANGKRILNHTTGGLSEDLPAAVHAGVWDTVMETTFPDPSEPHGQNNPFLDMEAALAAGREFEVIKPGAELTAFGAEAAANMAQDLAAGYWLVTIAPDGNRHPGWWRVRPGTGETLGIAPDGRGANASEYVILVTLVAGMVFMAVSHIQRERCLEEVRAQSGENLELDDPQEYELRAFQCTIGYKFWSAARFIDDELQRHEEICDASFGMQYVPGLCP